MEKGRRTSGDPEVVAAEDEDQIGHFRLMMDLMIVPERQCVGWIHGGRFVQEQQQRKVWQSPPEAKAPSMVGWTHQHSTIDR